MLVLTGPGTLCDGLNIHTLLTPARGTRQGYRPRRSFTRAPQAALAAAPRPFRRENARRTLSSGTLCACRSSSTFHEEWRRARQVPLPDPTASGDCGAFVAFGQGADELGQGLRCRAVLFGRWLTEPSPKLGHPEVRGRRQTAQPRCWARQVPICLPDGSLDAGPRRALSWHPHTPHAHWFVSGRRDPSTAWSG